MKTACFVCSPTVTPGSRTAGLLSSPNKPQDVDDMHVGLVRQRAVTGPSPPPPCCVRVNRMCGEQWVSACVAVVLGFAAMELLLSTVAMHCGG